MDLYESFIHTGYNFFCLIYVSWVSFPTLWSAFSFSHWLLLMNLLPKSWYTLFIFLFSGCTVCVFKKSLSTPSRKDVLLCVLLKTLLLYFSHLE